MIQLSQVDVNVLGAEEVLFSTRHSDGFSADQFYKVFVENGVDTAVVFRAFLVDTEDGENVMLDINADALLVCVFVVHKLPGPNILPGVDDEEGKDGGQQKGVFDRVLGKLALLPCGYEE